jgi:CheY-like chemotaxis protein/anti-sigma regulatory factor (Ser/Thr protein kinase)
MRAQEKGLQLLLDQTSQFPRYINGDEARLRQILVNLVGNAVKFTEQGGVTIRLGLKHNVQPHLLIEVEDSGPGISPEDQRRLFEPFVQLAQSAAQKGTGLGLAISRQFVQKMGGNITVESKPGKGSVFRVELPVELVSSAAVFKPEKREQGEVVGLVPGQPAYRILIAEDQHENRLLLSKLMTDIGLEVKVAENGAQCIELFREWQPHLIWMDRRMPVMDGEEATRRIRQFPDGKQVKIVAVTASAFREQQQEMLAAGMDDFVRKPYRFDEIYDCLARQLNIKYRYHTDMQEVVEEQSLVLMPKNLAALPKELCNELKTALESLEEEPIAAAISRVTELDAELGKALLRLSKNFNYPVILQALDAAASC